MRLKVIVCLILIFRIGYSQNDSLKIKDLFLKSQQLYSSKKAYQIDATYKVYNSLKSEKPSESYKSIIIKNGSDYYYKIHNTEFIQIGNRSLKMNHDEKALLLAKRQSQTNGLELINNMLSILPYFKSYDVTETDNMIVCKFVAPDITQLPFTKVLIYFNKEDYSMKEQILYLSNAIPYEEKGKIVYGNPRLEISMSKFKPYVETGKCKLDSYIKQNKNENILSDKYANYQLISKL